MAGSIEVIVLTGYLGAGKTTLLNRMLRWPSASGRRTALIVNEFGPANVDAALVRAGGRRTYEINQGSVFCVCTRGQLLKVLADIAADGQTELVLLEATGLAETADFESLLETPGAAGRYRVRANVGVVDPGTFYTAAAFLKAATAQVAQADLLVINKADTADAAALATLGRVLAEINPDARQVVTSYGAWEETVLDGVSHRKRGTGATTSPPSDIVAVALPAASRYERGSWAALLARLGDKVLRLKGVVDFGAGPRLVQLSGGAWRDEELPAGVSADTELVVIARGMSKDELRQAFAAACGVGG